MGKKPTLGEVVELTGPTLGDEVELTIDPPPDPFTSAPPSPQGGGQGLSGSSATQPVQQPVPSGMGGQRAQAAFDEAFSQPLPPVRGFVPEQPKQGPTPDSEFDRASKLDPRAVGAVYGDYELPDDYGGTKPIPGADPSTFKRGDLQATQERAKQKDAQAGPVRAWVTASNRVLDYEKEFSSLVEQADALRASGNIKEADAIQARIGRAAEGVTKNKEFAAVAQKQADAIFSTVVKDFKDSTEMLSGKFFREQEGVRVVDAESITKYVNERLVDMGLMDSNGRYNTDIDPNLDVKHTLTSRLMAEAENHQRERAADQALKAKLGERRIAMTEDVAKSFSSVDAVEAQLSAEAKNYSAGAKADVSKYEATTVNPAVAALKKTYDGSVAQVNAEADRINKLYEAGQITYEQANQAIDQANQGLQQATDDYNSGVDQLLKSSNEEVANINFRWNSKFKQEQEARFAAFEKGREAFQEEFRAKYGDDPNFIKELNRAYNDAWQKQAEKEGTNKGKEKAAYERYMKDVSGVRQMNRFYETFDEGLGGWYKTMGVTLGSSDMYDAGVRAESKYMLPQRDHKGVDDLLTVGWLETQGRLAGRMSPNIAATGLTAAATAPFGGVGGAATATRLAVTAARWGLSGGVGYVMETSDIAAQMRMDVLDKTGDIVKANKAADRVWEAQTAIAWSYLMEGAPFLKLPFAPKSRILGGLMGFGAEFGQEFFLQEGPQQMAEKRIMAEAEGKTQLREGLTAAYDDFYGGIKEMAKEGVNPRTGERQPSELEMLAVDLSGMGLLGVPGGVMSASQARNAKADMLKSYAADEVVAKYAEYGDMSFLNSLVEKRGAEFASELADVFRAAGQLDVVQHLDLKRKIESVSRAQADASSAKLTGDQKDAYTAIAAKVYEHRNAAANAESEISRKTHEARASEAEKMLIGIATGKDEKYFMVEHPNGKKVFMTEAEGRDMLNDFESFQTLTMLGMQSDGGVKITAYGAGNDVVLTQAWEAMLEWQEAMDRGVGRVSHRYGVDVEWTPSGLVVKAREGVSPQDAYDAEAILSRMGYKVKGFIAPPRQSPLNEEDVVDVVTKEPPTALEEESDTRRDVVTAREALKGTPDTPAPTVEWEGKAVTPKPQTSPEAQPPTPAAPVVEEAVVEEAPVVKSDGEIQREGEQGVALIPENPPTTVDELNKTEQALRAFVEQATPATMTLDEFTQYSGAVAFLESVGELRDRMVEDGEMDAPAKLFTEAFRERQMSWDQYKDEAGIREAIANREPISAEPFERYGEVIPSGYTKQGSLLIPTPNEAPAPRPTPTVEAAPPVSDVPAPAQPKRTAEPATKEAPTPPEPTGRDAGVGEVEITKGRVGFKTKKLADAFASRMGNWVVRKEGRSWVAIDNSSADFEAESAQTEAESAKEAAAANAEFEARQEAFLKQYPEAEADLMRVEEKIASGSPLTAKEVAIANDNIFRPPGYDFDETGSFVKAKAIEPKTKEQADAIDKAYKSASRFKPSKRVEFGSPITGPSGARLTAYEWKYKFEEYTDSRGEDRVKRVSDWDMAELSDETGRDIVHQFEVVDENGRGSLVSAESALKIMGYLGGAQAKDAKSMMSAAKTLAGYLMQLDGLRAELQIENDAKAKVAKMPRPEVVIESGSDEARGLAKQRKNETWSMGDAQVWVMYPEDGTLSNYDREERLKTLEWSWEQSEMRKLGVNPNARPAQKIAEIERKIATKERQLGAKATDVSPAAPKPPKGETKETPPKAEKPQEEVKPATKAAPISDKAKAIADKLRAGKLGGKGGLRSTIPGFEQAFDAAIEVAAITIETTGDVAQAISDAIKAFRESDWYKNATKAEREKQETALSDFVADAAADAPPPKAEPKDGDGKEVKKTIVTIRAYEGTFREQVKKKLAELGLYRKTETFDEAREKAKTVIEEIGLEAALEAVRSNDIPGGAGAFIWNEALKDIDRKIASEKDPQRLQELYDQQAELLEAMGAEYTSGGQRASALQVIFAESDLGFYSAKKATEWEQKFGEPPSEEMMAKWRERDKELDELRSKLKEAEEKLKQAKEQESITNIQESIAREKAKKTPYTRKAKDLADKFRKLKAKPMVFLDADGNPIEIQEMGFNWNQLVEVGAKAIEKTGQLADGIAAIVEKLKESKWYKSLDSRTQAAVLEQAKTRFEQEFNRVNEEEVEVGRIRVPKKMIREAVANGAKDIDSLVEVIREQLKESYPEATDREIRDAITEYGKVVNLSRDELSQEVRRIKRIGKIVSALEDVAEKKRPLRSGLQRDKLDAEERALNKQLREAMKDLPVDTEARERELKTALDAAKTRMRNRIEDLQREIDTKERVKRNAKSVEADEELKQLIQERDALQAQRDEIFGDKEITEEERLKRTIDATKRRIDEYNKRIKDGNLDPAKPTPVRETPELAAVRKSLKAAKDEYRRLQEEEGILEKKRLDTAKKVANARIEELRRRIDEGDFAQRPKPDRVVDDELVSLNAQKVRLKEEYDKEFYKHKLKNRTQGEIWKDQAIEAWGLMRAIQSTAEFSFVLIQGGAMTVSTLWHRPRAVARAFGNLFNAMKSEERSEEWHSKIKAQEWWPQAKKAKLAITEPHAEITAREELFMSDWTRMIWNSLGLPLKAVNKAAYQKWVDLNPMRGLERAASAYLDTLRVERYLDGYEMIQMQGRTPTDQELKDIADAVNTLTGRASLGKLETIAKGLTLAIYSPRLWASAIKTATPYAFYHFGKMTPTARKMAMQDMGRYVGTTMAFVALAAMRLNDDDDDETGVETDPRSSDFGKIKIGDTRIDPWGGRAQQVIFTSRIVMGCLSILSEAAGRGPVMAYKKGDQLMPLGMKGRSPTMFDTMIQMATNKAAPSASFMIEMARSELYQTASGEWKRKAPFKEDYSLSKSAVERLSPIYFSTIKELLEEDPGALEGFLIAYAFFGGGVQKYQSSNPVKGLSEPTKQLFEEKGYLIKLPSAGGLKTYDLKIDAERPYTEEERKAFYKRRAELVDAEVKASMNYLKELDRADFVEEMSYINGQATKQAKEDLFLD